MTSASTWLPLDDQAREVDRLYDQLLASSEKITAGVPYPGVDRGVSKPIFTRERVLSVRRRAEFKPIGI
jgi:hypothetical protein